MRYFKYKNINKTKKIAQKEYYSSLTIDEKQAFNKDKFWRRLGYIISFTLFITSFIACIYLMTLIPKPTKLMFKILYYIGEVVLGLISFIISGLISLFIPMPIWNKVKKFNLPDMKQDIFSKACSNLRDYYGLNEPCLTTKCYDSSDKNFKNQDVCIFIVGDELRITKDLKRGFLYGYKDLGCYAFKLDEITIEKKQDGKTLIAEIKVENVSFLLGYKVKSFIDKNYITEK
ncbi:MAG: hypothetical protein IJ458_00010 [Clostridia bacterium]|nr:hypothetical protein [Clostridia bacterium]